ncbi:MAG: hypothetical protein LBS55_10085 [Prevotellaceae bacterium]|jgi:hypothetical protein|nr:hypothetical protein [Prevotellaceae bacterium]
MKDYIPVNDSELVSWGNNFTDKISENAAEWKIPVTEVTKLRAAINTFSDLQKEAGNPAKTSVIMEEKNAARDIFVSFVQKIVVFRLNNPVITNAQRVSMGLPQKPLSDVYTPTNYSHLKKIKKKS